jgi:glycine/D-amino acid oxidase-like deaminating enzyme
METQDYLAFIGRNPVDHDNIYVVTGDSGWASRTARSPGCCSAT